MADQNDISDATTPDTAKNAQFVNGDAVSMTTVNDYEEERLTCGWFDIRPKWMQRFNTAPWLAAMVSCVMFAQGITVNGFVYINLSSVEKRFQLPSTATGALVSTYDLTVTLLIIFVSYFGATRNKARMLSIGGFIIGCGSLLWAVPHFTTGPYQYDIGKGELETLCRPGENITDTTDCDDDWQSLSYYFIVFACAQVLHGIGASPLYTVGYAYVDENVGYRKAAWYTGILSAFSIFGPCAGFFVGALFLTIYTDIGLKDEVTITLSDPAWVGCWWIGFLVGCLLSWIVAIPMGAFPPVLPETKNLKHERQSQAHYSKEAEDKTTRAGFGKSWRDLGPATLILFKNPTFILICLIKAMLTFIIGGFTPFMPKFLENQFGLNSSAAAVLLGITTIPGAAGGTLLGGWVIKRFDLKMLGALKFCLGIAIVTVLLSPIFLLRCPEQQSAGIIASYNTSISGKPGTVDLNSGCNSGCQCSGPEVYTPVCGENGLVYFDACYAGCQDTVITENDEQFYYNCSCIDHDDGTSEAVSGKCSLDCWQLPVFIVLFFLIMLLGFMIMAPTTILTLRCVPDSQRSYALGISSIFYRVFGSIPGPIICGLIIDSSCLLWQEVCDKKGSCWIYDNTQFAVKFFVTGAVIFILNVIFLVITIFVYKAPPEEEDSDKKVEENGNQPTTMEEDTKSAIMNRQTSTVELLGYTNGSADNIQADEETK